MRYSDRIGAVLLIVSALLRLSLLIPSSVWLDEAVGIYVAKLPIQEIISHFQHDFGPPFYLFVLKGWMALFGNQDQTLALLSVIFSSLTPFVVYVLSKRLFVDPKVTLFVLLISVFNTVSLEHATNIRYYAMLELLTALSYFTWFAGYRILYVIIALMGIYTHYFFSFVLLSQGVITIFFYRKELKRYIVSMVITALGFSLWLPILWTQFNGLIETESGVRFSTVYQYGGFISAYLYSIAKQIYFMNPNTTIALGFVGVMIILFFLIQLVSYRKNLPNQYREAFVLYTANAVILGVPLLIAIKEPILVIGRYDIICIPSIAIVFGWLYSRLRIPFLFPVLLILYATHSVSYIHWWYRGDLNAEKRIIKAVAPQIDSEDVIVYTGISQFVPDYYLSALGVQPKAVFYYPEDMRNHGGFIKWEKYPNAKESAKEIKEAIQNLNPRKVILFISDHEKAVILRKELSLTWSEEEVISVPKRAWGAFYNEILILAPL